MKVIKNILSCFFAISLLLLPAVIGGMIETTYTMCGEVVSVMPEVVVVEDEEGELWEFCGDGYTVNDKVKLIFNTNCTDNTRLDDQIKNVKKI